MLTKRRRLIDLSLPLAALCVVTAVPGMAQPPRTAAKSQSLTVNGVIEMAQAGLSDDIIIARLHKEQKAFELTSEETVRLKKANVSDAVIKVMLDPSAPAAPPRAAAPPPAAPPPAATPAQVVITPSIPGVARPSGATPGAGEATGDLDDPMSPHDSGIYLLTKDRDGRPQMVVLERAGYQGSKTGGMLMTSLTYGLKKTKTKAVIPGAKAGIRVTDASPVFYFYFDDKQAGLGKTNFGVGSLSNPNQFALLRLEVKGNNRETIIGQFGLTGTSMGSDDKSMVPFKSERIRPGLYKVTVSGLGMGEYCFLASGGQGGAMMSGAMTAVDIFDFGVSVE
jgi:hypothetical protein